MFAGWPRASPTTFLVAFLSATVPVTSTSFARDPAPSDSEIDELEARARKPYGRAAGILKSLEISLVSLRDGSRARLRQRRASIALLRRSVRELEVFVQGGGSRAGRRSSGGQPASDKDSRGAKSHAFRPWPVSARPELVNRAAGLTTFDRVLAAVAARARRESIQAYRVAEETRALVQLVLGDLDQCRADTMLRARLGALENDASPAAVLTRAKTLVRLREFGAAIEFGRTVPADLDVGVEDRCTLWNELHRAALFAGDAQEQRRYDARIQENCKKEVEPARIRPPLRSTRAKRADLVDTVKVSVDLLTLFRLPRRERALVGYFAGVAACELGEFALAEELLSTGSRDAEGDDWLVASIHARLALALDGLGDFEGALRALGRARAVAGSLTGTGDFSARLGLLEARTLLSLGKRSEALAIGREWLSQGGLSSELRISARLVVGTALYLDALESPARVGAAVRVFDSISDDVKKLPEGPRRAELEVSLQIHRANVRRLLALGASDSGEAERHRSVAIEWMDSAMREAHEKGWRQLAALAASNLGELHIQSGDAKAASSFVDWSLERARETRAFDLEWRAHWYRARIATQLGDSATADTEYARAIELVESRRERILDAGTKRGYMSNKIDLYRDAVRRELARGRPERAFELSERSRAQALVESLGWRFVALADAEDTALYREYIRLVGRESRASQGPGAELLGVTATLEDFGELRQRLRALRERILRSPGVSPVVKALVDGAPATSATVSAAIGADARLLSYFDLGGDLVAFVVGAGKVSAVSLGVPPVEIRARVQAFLRSGASDPAAAKELYENLLAPCRRLLSAPRLVVVPYGSLHGVPFEAFVAPEGYAVTQWEMSYLPSASVLRFLEWSAPKDSGPPRLLALADPFTDYDGDGRRDKVALAGARSEVASFETSFRAPDVFYGEAATEGRLRSGRGAYDVLHIACHGEFYGNRPWDSTLFLAPESRVADASATATATRRVDRGRDGLLRAHEVYSFDLRGLRLVTLSGCETGVSDVSGGDDPAGLATAFVHSGASSLLVSLWKVEDQATAALMKSFYRRFVAEGRRPGAALREAKLDLLRGGFGHPRQWASFVLIADG